MVLPVSAGPSTTKPTSPAYLAGRPHVAPSAIFVLESGVGSHATIENETLLSVEWANVVVLKSPQLVMLVLGQLLGGLVRQVLQ